MLSLTFFLICADKVTKKHNTNVAPLIDSCTVLSLAYGDQQYYELICCVIKIHRYIINFFLCSSIQVFIHETNYFTVTIA